MLPEEYLGENRWTEFYEWEEEPQASIYSGKISIMNANGNDITINSSESLLTGAATCELYSMGGKLLESRIIPAIHEHEFITITTQEELPNGIYLVTLSSPEGRVTEKFLIAR